MSTSVAAAGITAASTILVATAGFVFILAFLGGTYVWWKALSILKWDKFIHDPLGHNVRLLRFLLACTGGFIIGAIAVAYALAAQAMRILF